MNYRYSIEVARAIYSTIQSEEEALSVCKKNIEAFYREKGEQFTIDCSDEGLSNVTYNNNKQSITLGIANNTPAAINLSKYDNYTEELVRKAFLENSLFGIPVFMITIMQDLPFVLISLMSRETYLSLDKPQEQDFIRKMYSLDDLMNRCGGNN